MQEVDEESVTGEEEQGDYYEREKDYKIDCSCIDTMCFDYYSLCRNTIHSEQAAI